MSDDNFLNFRQMISGTIIKAVYAGGAALIVAAGLFWMAYPFIAHYAQMADEPLPASTGVHVAAGSVLLVFGSLLWRLLCEGWILLFSVHEILASIEKNSERTAELLDTLTRQMVAIDENAEQRHKELTASQLRMRQS